MVSYPVGATFVQPDEPLALVVELLTRPKERSVAQVAAANDTCPARLHDLMERARRGLEPRPPGPTPGQRAQERDRLRLAALEARPELEAFPVLTVHDSLMVECREEAAEEVARIARQVMTRYDLGGVPIVVDAAIGPAWGSLVELKEPEKQAA